MDFKEFKSRFQRMVVTEVPSQVKEQPLVSVCVQTFQHASYIEECLDGILKQRTTFKFEILLGEDESIDGTREICYNYAEKYPDKIRLFLHSRENNIKVNEQPTGRFNFLYNLFSAKGKFIAFCEGDDFWADHLKLQKQVDFLKENENYVACFHDSIIEDTGKLKFKYNNIKNDYTQEELIKLEFPIATLTLCFRNVIKEYPEEFCEVSNGDTFLCFLLGFYGKTKFLKNMIPAVYRKHQGGVWSSLSFEKQKINRAITFQTILKYLIRNKRFEYISRFNDLTVSELKMIKPDKKIKKNNIIKSLFKRNA